MTASKTPTLGLMNPVSSDPFTTTDFATTFQTLDTVPGILTVANNASRPTGWSSAQHGRMVWQADLNVMWIWNQPSSGVAGVWVRSGTTGWLGGTRNTAQVNTTAISVSTAPTVCSVTVMVPGGRPTLILYDWVFIGNDPAKSATLNLIANSINLYESRHLGNGFGTAYGTATPYPPQSSSFAFIRNTNSAQESVTFQLKLRCQDPAAVGSAQGGGTSFITNVGLNIMEM